MGIAIPQVVTSDRATGAQVIDGSLKFDKSKSQYLTRTPGSAGNRKTFTISLWRKGKPPSAVETILHAGPTLSGNSGYWDARIINTTGEFKTTTGSTELSKTNAVHRDTGWYHIVFATDTTQASGSQHKIYVNGVLQSLSVDADISNTDTAINQSGVLHHIGSRFYTGGSQDSYLDSYITQFYFIDGQALDASYFGFTDGLTNTWRPKKYEGTFGTNGFYLPMDGNSPIGQDKSGNGNDWTPVNFGGSVELDNPNISGARPILNTTQGGTTAGVGVFGSKQNVGYAVTVYDDGGGNKYYIDGVKQATLTGLIRGATYTFDTSDSTVGSTHPFRFSESDGGSEYTNGVAAITGAATTITVPYNAPETLYYYCTSHSGMGADITGITTNEKLADQYASHCTLALPLVGADDDVCASIACTANNKTPTNSSVTASTTQSNFYGGSHHWNAATDTLQYAEQGNELVFGTGDFTIECWVYDDNSHNGGGTGRCYIFDNRIGGSVVGDPPTMVGHCDSHNEFTFYDGDSEVTYSVPSTVGKWWHYAVTREGTTTRMFIDGVLRGSSTSSTNFTNNGIGVGRATDGGYGWAGYIQDFRVYKGVAKYTSNFVVPSTSPDILPDTPSGVSGGSKLTKITDGAVSFDGTGDYLRIASTSDFDQNPGTDFTAECFFYMTAVSGASHIFGFQIDANNRTSLYFTSGTNTLNWWTNLAGSNGNRVSASNVSTNAWHHVAITRSGSTTTMWLDGISQGTSTTTDYPNGNQLLDIGTYNAGGFASDSFPGFISNVRYIKGTALYTSNFTPPSAPLTNVTNTKLLCCQSNTSATASVVEPSSSDGTGYTGITSAITVTSASLNAGSDTNTVDGNTSTSADIRGAGSFVQLVFPQQQNGTLQVNVANGNDVNDDNIRVFIDGVEGTSFDVSSQQWYTIHTGDFTTVKLEHQGSTTGYIYGFRIGTDGDTIINASGGITANGDAAATTFNPFNTDINKVRGQETGYATLNPLINGAATLSDGNLTSTAPSGSTHGRGRSTLTMDTSGTGKFYFEATITVLGGTYPHLGVIDSVRNSDAIYVGDATNCFSYRSDGQKQLEGTASSYGDSYAVGDTIGCSIDCGSGELRFYKNGVDQGVAKTITANYHACFAVSNYGSSGQWKVNFGQKPFKFPPPDGFQPLNAANVRPSTVIARPNQYVGITTWSGDGNTRDISVGLKPDLVWIKNRSSSSYWHQLQDSVRGPAKSLFSNATNAEDANSGSGYLSSFNYSGFTVTTGSVDINNVNGTSNNYVAWCWKAGGNKNTFNVDDVGYATAAAAGLTAGTITPVGSSVGTKQGFSIIQYQGNGTAGAQVPHGLTQTPDFTIIKAIDSVTDGSWFVGGNWAPGYGRLLLNSNTTDNGSPGNVVAIDLWNDTAPTSSVITIGAYNGVNDTGDDYIMYNWHDVLGLQKFGSYTGNSSSDGIFIETGFRPAVLWIKTLNTASSWYVYDSEREKFNPVDTGLFPNLNNAESTNTAAAVDLLSNGFKFRGNAGATNSSSYNYIYCAWAEAPSVDLYGGGANAR